MPDMDWPWSYNLTTKSARLEKQSPHIKISSAGLDNKGCVWSLPEFLEINRVAVGDGCARCLAMQAGAERQHGKQGNRANATQRFDEHV